MIIELFKLIIALTMIVLISKYILVKTIRKIAEYLNLKPKTVGNISGFATSIPELLTTCISSITGFPGAGLYNILSSNIINFFQFFGTVIINNNFSGIKNKAIRINIFLTIITIIIPLVMAFSNIKMNLFLVPILLIIFILVILLNNELHRTYLNKFDKKIEKMIEKEQKKEIKKRKLFKYILILLLSSILLFLVGNFLGKTIEILCLKFNVSQITLGILLGFFTSLPEFITFFESQKHHSKSKNDIVGLVEATNNLLMSNIMNLFVILNLGIIIANIF